MVCRPGFLTDHLNTLNKTIQGKRPVCITTSCFSFCVKLSLWVATTQFLVRTSPRCLESAVLFQRSRILLKRGNMCLWLITQFSQPYQSFSTLWKKSSCSQPLLSQEKWKRVCKNKLSKRTCDDSLKSQHQLFSQTGFYGPKVENLMWTAKERNLVWAKISNEH